MSLPDSSSSDPVWRCVRTRPKCEHLAALQLRAAGFEVFCPRVRHQKKTARGRVWFVEALFPTYVFARFPLLSIRQVQATAHVTGLLTFCADFGRVPDAVVEALRAHFCDDEVVTAECAFVVGEIVSVVEGPLQGAQGVITKLLPGKERAKILLEFLGRQQEMEISLPALLGFRDSRREALRHTA